MRTRQLRMRRIMSPVSRGSKNDYIFGIPDSDLRIHYTTSIGLRRRLRVVYSPAVQCYAVFGRKEIQSRLNGPQKRRFLENGCQNLRYWFRDPQKALSCAEQRRLTYFASKSVHASPSVEGFLGGGRGSNFPLSHRVSSSPSQHFRSTVQV